MTIEIDLSDEQLALFSALAVSLRTTPGHAMLALAAFALETVPDTALDGIQLYDTLRRVEDGANPTVASEWQECGLKVPDGFTDDEIPYRAIGP